MFTKKDLKQMEIGIGKCIKEYQEIYSQKIQWADDRAWEVSDGFTNSLDNITRKIEELNALKKKIYEARK